MTTRHAVATEVGGPSTRGAWERLRDRARTLLAPLSTRTGLAPLWLAAAFILSAALIVLRDPSLFTNPQFWAEDGKVWYAQAYNGGWLHSLTMPLGGYLNTLQRLAAGLALLVPFRWAPLPMGLVGLVCEALPVPILLSPRCRNWAPLPLRILFAAVYIGIPDAREIHILCTNAHWHLAVSEVLLAFAAAPRSLFGKVFDICLFLLAGFCGPFGVLLLPFLFLFWLIRRQRWSLLTGGLLSIGVIVQIFLLRTFHETRHVRPLGASLAMFLRILGGDVYLAALRGSFAYGKTQPLFVCAIAAVIGLAISIYCFRFASLEVRLFFLYCAAIFAASMRSPLLPTTSLPLWDFMLSASSIRYWFFPSLIFLFSILWCMIYARNAIMKWTAVALAVILLQGIYRDWRIAPLVDMHFAQQAAIFQAAPPGTHVSIPLNPPTGEWHVDLTKK